MKFVKLNADLAILVDVLTVSDPSGCYSPIVTIALITPFAGSSQLANSLATSPKPTRWVI